MISGKPMLVLASVLCLIFFSGCSKRVDIPPAGEAEKREIAGLAAAAVADGDKGSPPFDGTWTSFQGGPGNTGFSGIEFSGQSIEVLWSYSPGTHVWDYSEEMAAWSPTPVTGRANGRNLVFLGSHDRNVYALDADTGEMVWQRATGGLAMGSPLFMPPDGEEPAVLATVSSDRTVYGLAPASGKVLWSVEVSPWSDTVMPSVTSSPAAVRLNGRNALVCTMFTADRRWIRSVQEGYLLVVGRDGAVVLKRKISTTPLSSPAVVPLSDGRAIAFVAERKGRIMAFSLPEGNLLWKRVLPGSVFGSPSAAVTPEGIRVFIGDFYGQVSVLDGVTGEMAWSVKLGFFINATPTVMTAGGETLFFVGSYDRMIHGFSLSSKKRIFSVMTGKYVSACGTIANLGGRFVIMYPSLDRSLYCVDGATGKIVIQRVIDDMLWPYEKPGRTLWPSVGFGFSGGRPAMFLPSAGGSVYALGVK